MTGIFADPKLLEYVGVKGPGVSVTGWLYGNPHQFFVQLFALLVIVGYDGLATWGILKLVGLLVPLRAMDHHLTHGDLAIHGERAHELSSDDDFIEPSAVGDLA